jgi:hypothetical protein
MQYVSQTKGSDRMWSLYLGRPESLDENAITVPRPGKHQTSSSQQCQWEPYVDDYYHTGFPPMDNQLEQVHHYNASLCAKMSRIREMIYTDSNFVRGPTEDLFDVVPTLRSELVEWYADLPPSLSVDESSVTESYLPHVLQLHMQYHCIMILANRPFLSRNTFSKVDAKSVMEGRLLCAQAATSISRLLTIYRRLYTVRRVNIQAVHLIFTASLIHVCNACSSVDPQTQTATWQDLEVCCQALEEIGQGYKNAIRGLEVVKSVKSELLRWGKAHSKRGSTAGRTSSRDVREVGRKKRRLTDGLQEHPGGTELDSLETLFGPSTINTTSSEIDSVTGLNTALQSEFPWDAVFWPQLNTDMNHFGF